MPLLLALLTSLLTFLTLSLAHPATSPNSLPQSAIINIEAIWDDTTTTYTNKTFAVPLNEVWQHAAFNQCNYLYLIGAKGNVDYTTIQCQLYWMKPNGMNYAGLWLTSRTPSSPHDVAADLGDASLQLRCSV